jgi:alpha-amylase
VERNGIFEFMKSLPDAVISVNTDFTFFHTLRSDRQGASPVGKIHVPIPISWADEERDLTAWLGNDLQDEAFAKLYELEGKVSKIR